MPIAGPSVETTSWPPSGDGDDDWVPCFILKRDDCIAIASLTGHDLFGKLPHTFPDQALRPERTMKSNERRKEGRVTFDRGIPAFMMAIDGTWRRDCFMEDVSQTGAKLTVEGSVEGLHLKEFFLLLSSTGLAYRRCELTWVNGDQIGVSFIKQGSKKKKTAGQTTADA
jgi:hypothetical protein